MTGRFGVQVFRKYEKGVPVRLDLDRSVVEPFTFDMQNCSRSELRDQAKLGLSIHFFDTDGRNCSRQRDSISGLSLPEEWTIFMRRAISSHTSFPLALITPPQTTQDNTVMTLVFRFISASSVMS